MDWSAQTNEIMKTCGEAQKQLWSGWMSLAQGATMGQAGQMFDPMQFFRMGADTWSGLREGPAQRLAGNIVGGPEIMTRSMNMLMQAWQAVTPKVEQGKPWQPDLQKLLQQWREDLANAPKRAASMQGDFAQLAKSLFERWTPVTGPLMSMVSQATAGGHPGAAFLPAPPDPAECMGFGEMFQGPFNQLSVGQMPRATVAREKMGPEGVRRAEGRSRSAGRVREGPLRRACGIRREDDRASRQARREGREGDEPRDLMRTWYSIADRTLMQKFNTEEFLRSKTS